MKQSASQADQRWAAHRPTAMSLLPTGSWLRRARTREWQLPRRFPPSDRASTRMEAATEPQSQPFIQSATCGREYVCSLNTRRGGRVRLRTRHNLALDAPCLNAAAGGSVETDAAALSSLSVFVASRYSCTHRSMTVEVFSTLVNCPTT